MKYKNAYDVDVNNGNLTQIWKSDDPIANEKIFEFGESNIQIEYEKSNFNQHRLAVIRHTIEKNLAVAISNYNIYSGAADTNVFQMPELKEDEWDYITHNISLISFLQGLPIGGKIYNGYTLVTNSESKEVVLEQNIYILGKDENGQPNYYRIGDQNIEDGNVEITAGDYANSSDKSISAGRLNLDFNRYLITHDNASYYYYPMKDYRGSYNSIIIQDNMTTYDDIYAYVNEQENNELKKAFYVALGRERGSRSLTADVLTEDYITVTMVNGVEVDKGYLEAGNKYSSAGLLGSLNKKGYKFNGWNTERDGSGQPVTPEDICTSDITVYAQWEKKSYKIQFNVPDENGNYTLEESRTINNVHIEDILTPITNVDIPGKQFKGWFRNITGSGDPIENGDKLLEDIIPNSGNVINLYAKLSNETYIVTFDANGGNVTPNSKDVEYSKKYGELPTPTRIGYTFDGWYTERDGGTEVNENTIYNTAGDTKLYAHWTGNGYTVTFDNNVGGTLAGKKTVIYGQPYGTLMNTSRQGYTFLGWYTEKDGGNQVTADTIYTIDGDSTLYAHWSINEYTLYFDANGGNVSPTSQKVKYKGTYGEYGNLPTPTRPGYTFLGWYTAASGGNKVTKDTVHNNLGDTTIYAHWEKSSVTLTNMVGNADIEKNEAWGDIGYDSRYYKMASFKTQNNHRYFILTEWNGWAYENSGDGFEYKASIRISPNATNEPWNLPDYHVFKHTNAQFFPTQTAQHSSIYTATSSTTEIYKYLLRNNSTQGGNNLKLKMFVDITELETLTGTKFTPETFLSKYGIFYGNKVVTP